MNKILIVEDDHNIALGIEDNLKMEGFMPVLAHDGHEALEKVKTEKPDLIILDIMLPKLRGLDVCRKLKEDGSKTPIIILSALGQESDKVAGLELGADDYVTKPFSPRELVTRVKTVLRRAQGVKGTAPEAYKFGRGMISKIYEDILTKDILLRHNITKREEIKKLAKYLITNSSEEITYSKLARIFNIKIRKI